MWNLFGRNVNSRKRKVPFRWYFGDREIEALEQRLVLASQIYAVYDGKNLSLFGSGDADDVVVTITGTNVVTLSTSGVFTTSVQSSYLVPGALVIDMGNGDDSVTLNGVAGTLDAGYSTLIDLGTGNDTFATTGTLTLTGDISIVGGAGDDIVSLGTATGAFTATHINVNTSSHINVHASGGGVFGPSGAESVTLNNVTAHGNVSITNGGTGVQFVSVGQLAPNSIDGDLLIVQADGGAAYMVTVRDTDVGGRLAITNGSGTGAAVVTVSNSIARTVQGTTRIFNGNNFTNSITLDGSAAALLLKSPIVVSNGRAVKGNTIAVISLVKNDATTFILTNGVSPINTITVKGWRPGRYRNR